MHTLRSCVLVQPCCNDVRAYTSAAALQFSSQTEAKPNFGEDIVELLTEHENTHGWFKTVEKCGDNRKCGLHFPGSVFCIYLLKLLPPSSSLLLTLSATG